MNVLFKNQECHPVYDIESSSSTADVRIIAKDGSSYLTHQIVLRSFSLFAQDVFTAVRKNYDEQVIITEYEPEVIQQFIIFLYTGVCYSGKPHDVQEVLDAFGFKYNDEVCTSIVENPKRCQPSPLQRELDVDPLGPSDYLFDPSDSNVGFSHLNDIDCSNDSSFTQVAFVMAQSTRNVPWDSIGEECRDVYLATNDEPEGDANGACVKSKNTLPQCSDKMLSMAKLKHKSKKKRKFGRRISDECCFICSKSFSRRSELKRHLVVVHELDRAKAIAIVHGKEAVSCGICSKVMSAAGLNVHIASVHRSRGESKGINTVSCDVCNAVVPLSDIKQHRRDTHPTKKYGQPKIKIRCVLCGNSNLSSHSYFGFHMGKIHKVIYSFFSTVACAMWTVSQASMKGIFKVTYNCSECDFRSSDVLDFNAHQDTESHYQVSALFKCTLCESEFSDEVESKSHWQSHMDDKNAVIEQPEMARFGRTEALSVLKHCNFESNGEFDNVLPSGAFSGFADIESQETLPKQCDFQSDGEFDRVLSSGASTSFADIESQENLPKQCDFQSNGEFDNVLPSGAFSGFADIESQEALPKQCDIETNGEFDRVLTSGASLSFANIESQETQPYCSTEISSAVKSIRKSKSKRRFEKRNGDVSCFICSKYYPRRSELKRHLVNVHKLDHAKAIAAVHGKDAVACNICSKVVSAAGLIVHVASAHKSPKPIMTRTVSCDVCKEVVTLSDLKKHRKDAHPTKKHGQPKINIRCILCGNTNICSHSAFGFHMGKKHKVMYSFFSTVTCAMKTMSQASMCGIYNVAYNCSECDFSSSDVLDFNAHQDTESHTRVSALFKCTLCELEFSDEVESKSHWKTHMNEKNVVVKQPVISRPNMLSCDKCDKKFKSKKTLEDHYVRHSVGELGDAAKKFTCEICFQKFAFKYYLDSHMAVHLNPGEFKCSFDGCKSEFSSEKRLHIHTQIHKGLIRYECVPCGKVYKCHRGLALHKSTFHENKYPCLCTVCGRAFTTKQKCDLHMIAHDENAPRPFICDICGHTATTRGNLRKHKMKHNKRTFICSICGFGFYRNSNLLVHLKSHERGTLKIKS